MTNLRNRVLAVLCALTLLVCTNGSLLPAAPVAAAPSLDDLEAQLKDLQSQEKEIKNELASASSDLSSSKKRKELLESQIENAEKQIALLSQRITAAEEELALKEAEIAAAEETILDLDISISYTHDRLGDRLRAIAKTGNMTAVQRLLNTDNYEEYLLKSKAAECIAKQDQALMDKLEEALEEVRVLKAQLEVQKQEIAAKKTALEADKATSDAKKKELDTLCAAVQSEIKKLQSSVSGYNDELKEVQKKIEEADAEIERIIKETQSVGKYDQDMMYWPVPAVRNISSVFGERWGKMHRGIDISNGPVPIYGQNIYAAADGVVIAVNYTSSYGTGWSYGYGYCVLVDHGLDSKGRKVTTMYAHASKMFARVGDVVKGGETVLAQAGRTGNVTGPHLHFEVRLDGVRVNPYPNYVHPDVNIPKGK